MDKQLLKQTAIRFGIGVLAVMLVLFLPAGSLRYAGGWRFLCVLFLPMLIVGVLLLKKNPELLRKRLENKEQDKTQKAVIALTAVLFLAG